MSEQEQAIQKEENSTVDNLSITTIRTLAIDAIEKANSGHPGMPMGSAPMGYQLFAKTMNHNPDHPTWVNRDRFVLSAGHGSMLLYSLLHLSGYDLPMEELKQFRQWGSLTPGHPEVGHTAGVDATTGPLGQGIGMAVGMAMAEAQLGATYNKEGHNVVDHYTYAICGDGDLMEGISSESASLAGHLKLGKLVVLYDSNDISLDGKLNLSFSENVAQRFDAYGWQVLRVEDGNDLPAIEKAIAEAQAETSKPTLIEVKTVIGYGSPNKQGKGGHGGTHGSPLGAEEAKLTKDFYKWVYEEDFYVPDEVRAHFAEVKKNGIAANKAWDDKFAAYKKAYPELAAQFETVINGDLPEGWDANLPTYTTEDKAVSTRVASGSALNGLTAGVPQLVGGSADLESSTMTHLNGLTSFTPESYDGRNIYFGVREFGMAAAMNGIALHTGLKVFGGTFFVFTDYLRPAIRLASIMKLPVTYVLTHDSIAVGEDGPTHEPIEQLASLRIIPGLTVIRPADANETSAAWAYAMENKENPVALVLTRQNLPILAGTVDGVRENIKRGGYVVSDSKNGTPQAQLIATGSEVQLAVKAQAALAEEGIDVRVISLPSWDLFEKQDKEYRDSVILPGVKARLAIEMAQTFGWERYTGDQGDILGITTFGASAPGDRVMKEYGFTVENVVSRVKALL
ncbi:MULTISPECIES: transketolase [Paenibacillus]|jgi:transketolase|uniref:Transketolase n=1 Tax=Paenibacillus odorifer TaxID=189426 RepID=A0A1R0YVG3_9BACL|nr:MULTISPECIES: transketolase [Paenibacillus]AWV32183.1 transketolase [Paenibacillus odorifer]ETT60277.1 transketolase [Paenibacillus sp. FSL H8-237]MEC0134451.1 transketolase [Paenibacillus odorifer]MEC0225386.1 transketolase [Paenibacillus odorifer]OMC79637.1 transketolase [Paenibacillus odorifer]